MTSDTGDRIRAGLRDLAERAPTGADLQARLEADGDHAAHPSPRRWGRETAIVLAAAAAVAVTVGVIALLPGRDAGPADDGVVAAPGTVLVGRGRAVVSVPESWGRNDVRCGVPTQDTVMFVIQGMGRGCAAAGPRFDSVSVLPTDNNPGYRSYAETDVAGHPVFTSAPEARRGLTGAGRLTLVQVVVPDQDARFVIRTGDAGLAEEIAGSIRILPADRTAVPDLYTGATGGRPGEAAVPDADEVTRRLEQAGLAVRIVYAGRATPGNWASLTADPEPGEVVATGTEVTVTYSAAPKRR